MILDSQPSSQPNPVAPPPTSPVDLVYASFDGHAAVLEASRRALPEAIAKAGEMMVRCLEHGGKVVWCGNGGSAADAQHLAAELVGRFETERSALASLALTTDTSILTAVGNDYGYDQVFARQVRGLMTSKDVLVAISTSGNSESVVRAVAAARELGITTIGLLGRNGGRLAALCDLPLIVPSQETSRIQEMHILIGHSLCRLLDAHFT